MQSSEERFVHLNGTAEVKEGQVLITDPQEGGTPALISPGEHVQVLVNGEMLADPQEVTSTDKVVVVPNVSEPDWSCDLRLSSDKMSASITINRSPGVTYEVQDQPPTTELTIQGRLVDLVKPRISSDDLTQKLKERGINFGIMPEMLQLALDSEQPDEYLVAKGEPPTPGVDAQIRRVFEEKKRAKAEAAEGVPLVHLHEILSVEPRELLVEVIPPKPGKSGTDVQGNPVPPPPPKDIILTAGTGAEVDQGGTKAIATLAGRPMVNGHTVSVIPAYILTEDVDAKIGQIDFKGDVTIQGNVLDGMKVEARGKVIINGYVANATIIAGGDVLISKNMVGGTVRAGGISSICQRLLHNLQLLTQELKMLVPAVAQLKNHPSVARNKDYARLGDGILLKMLLDTRFKKVPALLKEIGQDLEELVGAVESRSFVLFRKAYGEFVKKVCARVPVELNTTALIESCIKNFMSESKGATLELEELSSESAKLSVAYAQNAHLESSGDVLITSKGCYSSNIYAGGDVVIYGSPGVFRAGEIIAGGNVKIRELGSRAEAITTVEIGKGKTLTADRAYPGVAIKAGARVEKINALTKALRIEAE